LICEGKAQLQKILIRFLAGRDYIVETLAEKKKLVGELKQQWKTLWRDRIDDKIRAEGIADKDYSLLFVERGTVIIATRKCEPPDFYEILQQHKLSTDSEIIPPNPSAGRWGKFIRSFMKKQPQFVKQRKTTKRLKTEHKESLQQKKGGRGWLHFGINKCGRK